MAMEKEVILSREIAATIILMEEMELIPQSSQANLLITQSPRSLTTSFK